MTKVVKIKTIFLIFINVKKKKIIRIKLSKVKTVA